jgi:hypothetical protein
MTPLARNPSADAKGLVIKPLAFNNSRTEPRIGVVIDDRHCYLPFTHDFSEISCGFLASAYLALAIAEKRNAIPYLDRQRTLVGYDVGQMDQTERRISLRRSSEERLDGIHGCFPMLWLACIERQGWSLHAVD